MPLRRPHRKSRNGCIECKRRRVKCNEQHPCHNCLKYQSQCVYQTDLGQKQRRSPGSGKDPIPTADATASSSVIGAMELLAGPSSVFDFSSTADLALQDLELMHHFTTSAARTLSHRSDIQDTWAIALPKEAYTCDYLMDGLLALSALHIDSVDSEPKRHDYAGLSTYHLQRSLARFREKLADISTANCVPLFGLSSLMVILVCAQSAMESPSPRRETSLSPLAMLVKIFNMCRGVETILAPYRGEIQQCSLRPLLHQDYSLVINISRSGYLPNQPPSEEETSLAALADFIKTQNLSAQERTIYLDALTKLHTALRFMHVANEPLEPGAAFVWPILLQRDFISLMQRQAPVALVLTSFYCVVLHLLDGYWFLSGWCRSLLFEIGEGLSEEMQVWMRWPRRVCGLEGAA